MSGKEYQEEDTQRQNSQRKDSKLFFPRDKTWDLYSAADHKDFIMSHNIDKETECRSVRPESPAGVRRQTGEGRCIRDGAEQWAKPR